jgi:hypothetical protein
MSVKQSYRGESSTEFLKELRDLEIYLMQRTALKPKRYKFFIEDNIINPAARAYSYAKAGNSIRVRDAKDAENRRKYMFRAYAELQAVIGQIEVFAAFRKTNDGEINYKELQEVSRRANTALKLLNGVIKSDYSRYKNL